MTAPEPELAHEDDPFQCAYCGRPAEPEAARCPHCRRSLLVPGNWPARAYQYVILLLMGLQLQSALLQSVAVYIYLNFPEAAARVPFPDIWAHNLLAPTVVRAILWAGLVLLLLGDYDEAYPLAGAAAALDAAWAGVGYRLDVLGGVLAGANAALAGAVLLMALAATISQRMARRRLRVVLDRSLQGWVMYHERGEYYARRGQWALAVLHWRRATALRPYEPALYKNLGLAQMKLGRREQARMAFGSGLSLAPNDAELARLLASVGDA